MYNFGKFWEIGHSHFAVHLSPKMKILSQINVPKDLRALTMDQLPQLAQELREFIIDIVSTKEGHLGASLGVVELTIALHYVFNTPNDKIIWDVGHQAYGHKILTGRKERFNTNRQLGGISGFPHRKESEYDAFGTGHSSTSISAILGMAMASKLKGANQTQHIAVIGDASIASGMAFEALNHAGVSDANILVILNDNAIGIDPSVGALKKYLTRIKREATQDENIFECLNFDYSGPVDGNNIKTVIAELERLKSRPGPKLLHLITLKGKGLRQAEENQITYHSPGKFDRTTGKIRSGPDNHQPPKFQDVFGHSLVELAQQNPKIIGITPAMPTGSSLRYMMEEIPDRAFDVGIAEQHAVTLAAGMAAEGLVPYCTIYSTFLQRAYDQIIHDVALQSLPVVFCLDRAGMVGEDGATHHGVFDIAYLRCIPNLIIFAPMNEVELRNIMYTAQLGLPQPIAIRYPRGQGSLVDWRLPFKKIALGTSRELRKGSKIAILSIGALGSWIGKVIDEIGNDQLIGHYDMRFVKPLDENRLDFIFKNYEHIVTIEDGCKAGGFGSAILEWSNRMGYTKSIQILAIPDIFVEHGTMEELHRQVEMDPTSLKNLLNKILNADQKM